MWALTDLSLDLFCILIYILSKSIWFFWQPYLLNVLFFHLGEKCLFLPSLSLPSPPPSLPVHGVIHSSHSSLQRPPLCPLFLGPMLEDSPWPPSPRSPGLQSSSSTHHPFLPPDLLPCDPLPKLTMLSRGHSSQNWALQSPLNVCAPVIPFPHSLVLPGTKRYGILSHRGAFNHLIVSLHLYFNS